MAESPIPEDKGAKPGAKGKGPLASLSPKQKRYAAILGVAGFLALIFLLSRRTTPPAEELAPAEAGTGAPPQDFGTPAFPSTFADNGEAAAALGTSVTGGLADVADALLTQEQGFELLSSAVNEGIPPIGAGLSGLSGMQESLIQELRGNQKALEKALAKIGKKLGKRPGKKPGKGGGGKPGKGGGGRPGKKPGKGGGGRPGKGAPGGGGPNETGTHQPQRAPSRPAAATRAAAPKPRQGGGAKQSTLRRPGHGTAHRPNRRR